MDGPASPHSLPRHTGHLPYPCPMSHTTVTYSLASVNMRRRNAAIHTMLESNTTDDILFIQEPWFRSVSVARSNTHAQGLDVLGAVSHPAWLLLYPFYA